MAGDGVMIGQVNSLASVLRADFAYIRYAPSLTKNLLQSLLRTITKLLLSITPDEYTTKRLRHFLLLAYRKLNYSPNHKSTTGLLTTRLLGHQLLAYGHKKTPGGYPGAKSPAQETIR